LNQLEVVDLSDIIAGRPEDEALRTLHIICTSLKNFKLTEVNLSDNALGLKGVDACIDVLEGKKLEVFYSYLKKIIIIIIIYFIFFILNI
jgi:Ran GTPase-activating protein (RanGAP) involved in mRNA processing and transport